MNRKGFIDFDEIEPGMFLLPLVGFLMGFFTAAGGFSSMFSDTPAVVGLGTKLVAGAGGALIGFVAYYIMSNR